MYCVKDSHCTIDNSYDAVYQIRGGWVGRDGWQAAGRGGLVGRGVGWAKGAVSSGSDGQRT